MKNKFSKNNYKKDYFTSQEQMEIMMLCILQNTMTEIINSWSERNCLSKTEGKNIKMANTYISKFINELFARTSPIELKKLDKKMQVNTVRLYDKYEIDKMNKRINEAYEKTIMKEDDFCTIVENLMDVKCKNCTSNWKDCKLFKVFDEYKVPEFTGEEHENCKYCFHK